jgi:hypothetical protein
MGLVAASGLLGLDDAGKQLEPVESAEGRREFLLGALKAIKESGEDKLREAVAGADLRPLLTADPDFDGDLPSVDEWLQTEGLAEAF